MKIAILTWWYNTNYGGALQGIALQQKLATLGFNAELLMYDTRGKFGYRGVIFPIKRFLLSAFSLQNIIRIKRTKNFLQRYACKSSKEYPDYHSLINCIDYNLFIVGSDQIWKPAWMDKDCSFLLNDVPMQIHRISYAASIAEKSLEPYKEVFQIPLKKFDAVSLREGTLVDDLSHLIQKDVAWVVDPTLLLNRNEWSIFFQISDGDSNESYILVYWLSHYKDFFRNLIVFAKKTNKKIKLFMDVNTFTCSFSFCHPFKSIKELVHYIIIRIGLLKSKNITVCKKASAEEFVKTLALAEAVITDSFHGLMFSTIFEKNVKVVIPESSKHMGTRISDFVKRISYKNVLVNKIDADIFADRSEFDSNKLNEWIKNSIQWLKASVEDCRG